MISERILTDGLSSSAFSYQPQAILLNTVLSAILTTLLAYQAVAFINDLLLDLRHAPITTAADIQCVLLVNLSSLPSTLAALFRRKWLDSWRLRLRLPESAEIYRPKKSLRFSIVVKLLLLLLFPGVVNLVAVLLALEHRREVTFEEANFGGLESTFVLENQVNVTRFTESCVRFLTKTSVPADLNVHFLRCFIQSTPVQQPPDWRPFRIYIKVFHRSGVIDIELRLNGTRFRGALYNQVRMGRLTGLEDDDYIIPTRISNESLPTFFNYVQSTLSHHCDPNSSSSPPNKTKVWVANNATHAAYPLDCPLQTRQWRDSDAEEVLRTIVNTFSLVKTPKLLLLSGEHLLSELHSADYGDKLFMVTHSSNVSPFIMLLVLLGIIAGRITVKILTRNDIYDALEGVLKAYLGVEYNRSLLETDVGERVITFNSKYQMGSVGHFGVERPGWELVENFEEGVIIGGEERGNDRRLVCPP